MTDQQIRLLALVERATNVFHEILALTEEPGFPKSLAPALEVYVHGIVVLEDVLMSMAR